MGETSNTIFGGEVQNNLDFLGGQSVDQVGIFGGLEMDDPKMEMDDPKNAGGWGGWR